MTIEEIEYLIINFEMAVDKLAHYMYGHDDYEGKSNPDELRGDKRDAYRTILEAIKQYKEQK